jgi:hypothetical protein
MARFYFHLCDGTDVLLDEEGRELDLADIAAAAIAEARAMVAADAVAGHIYLDQAIEVRDADGVVVYCVAFEDAVQVTHEVLRPR